MTPKSFKLGLTDAQIDGALEDAFKRMAEKMGFLARKEMEKHKQSAMAIIRRALNEHGTIQEFDV